MGLAVAHRGASGPLEGARGRAGGVHATHPPALQPHRGWGIHLCRWVLGTDLLCLNDTSQPVPGRSSSAVSYLSTATLANPAAVQVLQLLCRPCSSNPSQPGCCAGPAAALTWLLRADMPCMHPLSGTVCCISFFCVASVVTGYKSELASQVRPVPSAMS